MKEINCFALRNKKKMTMKKWQKKIHIFTKVQYDVCSVHKIKSNDSAITFKKIMSWRSSRLHHQDHYQVFHSLCLSVLQSVCHSVWHFVLVTTIHSLTHSFVHSFTYIVFKFIVDVFVLLLFFLFFAFLSWCFSFVYFQAGLFLFAQEKCFISNKKIIIINKH